MPLIRWLAQTGVGVRDRVFVSYRRSDSRPSANAIRQTLQAAFGEAVFVDVSDLPPGAAFPDELRSELARARIVVVVIGPGWVSACDSDGRRRLDDLDDWVRLEVATALATGGVTVLPVLVDGAAQPARGDLPGPLQGLTERVSVRVDHDTWDRDWETVLDQIAELIGVPRNGALTSSRPTSRVVQRVDKGVAIAGDNTGTINQSFG